MLWPEREGELSYIQEGILSIRLATPPTFDNFVDNFLSHWNQTPWDTYPWRSFIEADPTLRKIPEVRDVGTNYNIYDVTNIQTNEFSNTRIDIR